MQNRVAVVDDDRRGALRQYRIYSKPLDGFGLSSTVQGRSPNFPFLYIQVGLVGHETW